MNESHQERIYIVGKSRQRDGKAPDPHSEFILAVAVTFTYPRVVPVELELIAGQEGGIGVDVVERHPRRRFARL